MKMFGKTLIRFKSYICINFNISARARARMCVCVCVCKLFSRIDYWTAKNKTQLYFKTTLSEFLDWIVIPNMTQYQIDSQALFIKPYYVSRLVSSFFGNAAINTSVNARGFSRIFMYVIKVALSRDVAFSCTIFPLSDIQISDIKMCKYYFKRNNKSRILFCFDINRKLR